MAEPIYYKRVDFEVLKGDDTGDAKIGYVFNSKDGKVTANLFWELNNVEMRGTVGDNATFQAKYPLVNTTRNPSKVWSADMFLDSLIKRLGRGEYK